MFNQDFNTEAEVISNSKIKKILKNQRNLSSMLSKRKRKGNLSNNRTKFQGKKMSLKLYSIF